MRNESHRTMVGIIRDSVIAWRKREGWNNKSQVQLDELTKKVEGLLRREAERNLAAQGFGERLAQLKRISDEAPALSFAFCARLASLKDQKGSSRN